MQKKVILFFILISALTSCTSINNQPQNQNNSPTKTIVQSQIVPVSSADTNAAEPAIAAGKDGTIFVLWVEHKPNKEADILMQQFDSKGQATGEKVRVNQQQGRATAWRGDPPTITIDKNGAVYVGWTEKVENAKGAANTLYLSVSRDGGRSFDSPTKVNDDTAPASHGMHSLAVDDSGRVYFAWLDERYLNLRKEQTAIKEKPGQEYYFEKAAFFHHQPNEKVKEHTKKEIEQEPNAELYFAVSNDGGKTFSANKRLSENVCPCCKTSLLANSDGRVYVSWRQVLTGDFRHIAVAASTDKGNSFSAPVIVSDDQWQLSACPVSGAALSTDSNNNLIAAWFTGGKAGKQGFYTSASKDGGKTFSPRSLISESMTSGTPVLLSDAAENNNIVWTDAGKILMSKLQNGKINSETEQEIANGAVPAITFSAEKVFVSYIDKEKKSINLSVFDK